MQTVAQLLRLLDDTLNLQGRTATFNESTRLMGAVPEMDSMGVVTLLTAFEEQLGLSVDDDEIDGGLFETVGSLLAFINGKLGA